MSDSNRQSTRRAFFGRALKFGAGSMVIGSSLPGTALAGTSRKTSQTSALAVLPELPTRVFVEHDRNRLQPADRQGSRFTSDPVVVNLVATSAGQEVRVTCPTRPVTRVVLDLSEPQTYQIFSVRNVVMLKVGTVKPSGAKMMNAALSGPWIRSEISRYRPKLARARLQLQKKLRGA